MALRDPEVLPSHVLRASIKMADLTVADISQVSGMSTSQIKRCLRPGAGVSDPSAIAKIQAALAAAGVHVGYDPDFEEEQGAGVRSPEGWLVRSIG
jgi:hypothetical protein